MLAVTIIACVISLCFTSIVGAAYLRYAEEFADNITDKLLLDKKRDKKYRAHFSQ